MCCRCRKTSFRPALQDCKFSVVPFMPSLASPTYGTVHTIFFIHKFRHLFVFRYVSFIKMETHFSAVFFPSFSAPFFLSLFHTHIDPSEMSCCLLLGPGLSWRCWVRPSLNVRAIGEGCKTHRTLWKRGTWMNFIFHEWKWASTNNAHTFRIDECSNGKRELNDVSSAGWRDREKRGREIWNAKTQRRVFISIYISHEANGMNEKPRDTAESYNLQCCISWRCVLLFFGEEWKFSLNEIFKRERWRRRAWRF